MWRNFIYIIRNTEIIGFGNFSLFVISKKLRYGTSYIYSSSHNIFNVVLIYLSKIDLLREINFFVSTKSTIWLTELDYLVDHQESKKKWTKRNNRSPRPAFEKSRSPRSTYRTSETWIILDECVRYRSIKRMKWEKNIAENSSSQRNCSQRFLRAILVIAIQWKFFLRATQSTIFFIG